MTRGDKGQEKSAWPGRGGDASLPTTAAIRLITRCLITGGRPEEADLLALAPFFPTWETGMDYRIGDAVRHGKKLYLVTQPHTAQPEWTPDRAINLFRVVDRP